MIDDEKLKAIEAYLQEASAGPWEFSSQATKRLATHLEQRGGRTILYLDNTRNVKLDEATKAVDADMDFITRARDDMQLLVEEVRHLRAASADLRESYDLLTAELSEHYLESMRFKEALERYGDPRSYRRFAAADGTVIPAFIERDLGQAARVALGLELPQPTIPNPPPPPSDPTTQSE